MYLRDSFFSFVMACFNLAILPASWNFNDVFTAIPVLLHFFKVSLEPTELARDKLGVLSEEFSREIGGVFPEELAGSETLRVFSNEDSRDTDWVLSREVSKDTDGVL